MIQTDRPETPQPGRTALVSMFPLHIEPETPASSPRPHGGNAAARGRLARGGAAGVPAPRLQGGDQAPTP